MVEHRNIIRGTRFYFAKLVATQEISKFVPLSRCPVVVPLRMAKKKDIPSVCHVLVSNIRTLKDPYP
jgi:hypothetical protein